MSIDLINRNRTQSRVDILIGNLSHEADIFTCALSSTMSDRELVLAEA